jgi:molybdopterin/thiamine biosynthesis adenylyltransferase
MRFPGFCRWLPVVLKVNRVDAVSGDGAGLMTESRYSRQILFPGIGAEGQKMLERSRVLLVGCGGLGSVMAEILTRAGVGRLSIADRDFIEDSNLQRQSLYTEADCRAGLPKAEAAVRHLSAINSRIELVPEILDVNAGSIASLVPGHDLIMDGTDNFETRFLLNDASLKWHVPWVYGACVGAYGMCLAFVPDRTPCLRCVLEQLPPPGSSPTCDTAGVIGPIVHLVAALEAAEALKILTGQLERLNGRLVSVDLWENQIWNLNLAQMPRDPGCPACGQRVFEFLEGKHEGRTQSLCGRDAVQVYCNTPRPVDLTTIAERLAPLGKVTCNEFLLRASLDRFEIALFRDGRAIVRGTQDVDEAKRIYAKFIGS